ncbi:hypothetical protein DRQ07_08420 [candidate division KSB1 bacterium]|nr:MAG: hypothetical protein DRQ07_08420 [candidate division KSB1 bacterium]
MDIKEKLKYLQGNSVSEKSVRKRTNITDINKLLKGENSENEFGSFLKITKKIPLKKKHGRIDLNMSESLSSEILNMIDAGISLPQNFDYNNLIYLDTETTGLAGGTGTVPFLTGVGYFNKDSFCVTQYFMRDFSEEKAVLFELSKIINKKSVIVTYNGKCYDLNVLNSRFTISRLKNPFTEIKHLDLLFPARRLWKKRIGSCSLINIEKNILQFNREDDIPGYMIPSVYFDFVHNGITGGIEKIVTHNVYDIVSLAAINVHLAGIYISPFKYLSDWQDLFSLGRIFENLGKIDNAEECFKKSARVSEAKNGIEESLVKLAYIYKRAGDWGSAERIWKYIINKFPHNLEIHTELAKYYEHVKKDYNLAHKVVDRALNFIYLKSELYGGISFSMQTGELKYRGSRIKRKINNSQLV